MLSVALESSVGLDTNPPHLADLNRPAQSIRPPSLARARREALGRYANLMEEYELPLKVDAVIDRGVLVWYYRSRREVPPDDEYRR